MALVRWRPARELSLFPEDFNRMFEDFWGRFPRFFGNDFGDGGTWAPAVDVTETKDDVIVKAEVPGMTKDDIKVTLQDNILTIQGEKKEEREEKEASFHRVERSYGSFVRSFSLPTTVKSDKIHAAYKDGVLRITLPKVEEVKPKEIAVSVN